MSDPFDEIRLESNGAHAVVRPYGAHVTSWTTPDGDERLYLSARSAYRVGAAIRGGVPVIFPQFATEGPGPRHGFARTSVWERAACDAASATLRLHDDDATRAAWPHAFSATYDVVVSADTLSMSLGVTNVGATPMRFTAALHTYLRVRDVDAVTIDGLHGVRFRDQAAGGVERVEDAASVHIVGEVDRVYLDVPNAVTVREPDRSLTASIDGFRDVVVWNPGAEKAAALSDLDPDGWRHFVCIEAAVVAHPVELAPGTRWTGRQRLTTSSK